MKDKLVNAAKSVRPDANSWSQAFRECEEYFAPISSTLTDLAGRYHIRLEKYPHDAPCWCLNLSHPRGGHVAIEVFRKTNNSVRVMGLWTLDEYDSGTRYIKMTSQYEVQRAPGVVEEIVINCLKQIVLSEKTEWTKVVTGYGEYWSKHWTKDEIEGQIDHSRYPRLDIDLLAG